MRRCLRRGRRTGSGSWMLESKPHARFGGMHFFENGRTLETRMDFDGTHAHPREMRSRILRVGRASQRACCDVLFGKVLRRDASNNDSQVFDTWTQESKKFISEWECPPCLRPRDTRWARVRGFYGHGRSLNYAPPPSLPSANVGPRRSGVTSDA